MKRKTLLPLAMLLTLSLLWGCGNQESLELGKYVADDGLAWVILQEDNEFVFSRNIATSYNPTGSYTVESGKLTLFVTDEEKYIFNIKEHQLVFQSGKFAEALVEVGTVFAYTME